MTAVTYLRPISCQALGLASLTMRTGSMAALLLLTMVSWVGSFAQVSPTSDGAKNESQRTSLGAHSAHDCCGSLQILPTKPVLPLKPASMPCGDEHPCCVRPGPQTTPNLPSTLEQQKLVVRRFAAVTVMSEEARAASEPEWRAFTRRLEFNTVLRI